MPTYDYICSSCNNVWEERHKMDDRKISESLPCKFCEAMNTVKQTIAFTRCNSSYSLEQARSLNKLNNASALKERIQHIHNVTPGSTLNKTSTILDIR